MNEERSTAENPDAGDHNRVGPNAGISDTGADETWFGYERVGTARKAGRVKAVFDSVASRYDIMNDLMSGGLHRLWKAALTDWIDPRPGQVLLDVAGGTGDIAMRFLGRADRRAAQAALSHVPARAIICDINADMLNAGRRKLLDSGRLAGPGNLTRVQWVCGDAERLPIPSASVDAYSIAFGLRNVTDQMAALRDAVRVLRPGGRYACLEFGPDTIYPLREIYDRYSFSVVPKMGRIVARDEASYRYLVESIRTFPPAPRVRAMMQEAGLARVSSRALSGGIAMLHTAWRV